MTKQPHNCITVEERLALRAKYEPLMYRNYELDEGRYHAMFVAFMPSGRPYVVLSNVILPLERIVLCISEFDEVLGRLNNDGATGVPAKVG